MSKAAALRKLFERPGPIRCIGAHNPLGATLAERAGFDAVWASGLEISAAHALPDANILTMTEFLSVAESMNDAVSLPIVADCDTGFGNSNNVIYMVKKYEAAGVAAVCIEDKQFPKVNSFVPGRQELAPIAEFVGKIMAAKNAQRDPDFMVIARVEALIAGWGPGEALKRAHAYVEAGADAVLMHSKSKTPNEIVTFLERWDHRAPIVVVPTTYYQTTATELGRLGVKMVIYANHGLRAGVKAVEDTFAEILRADSTSTVEDRIAGMDLVFELQGMPQMKKSEEIYLRDGRGRIRAIIPAAGDHMDEYSMKHIAADIPMAMLDVNGKPLLQRQLETLNQCGISDVTVVSGYKGEKINVDGVKLVYNPDWHSTSELHSIMCAASPYDGRTLIAYSDLLFDGDALGTLLKSDADITVLVDRTYDSKLYAPDRRAGLVAVANPSLNSRRLLNVGAHKVVKMGPNLSPDEAHCEFTGLALFSRRGFDLLRQVYDESHSEALTDLLQKLIDRNHEVTCAEVSAGWMEIHSFADYRLACRIVA